MILDRESKKVIMLNPKTGTMTLANTFAKYSTGLRVEHEHTRLTTFKNIVLEDYKDYTVYCFYRNPVDRFISGFNYSKTGKIPSFTNYIALLYRDKKVPLFTKLHEPIDEFTEAIQDLHISEFLAPKDSRVYDCAMNMDCSFVLEKQVSFCDHPNVVLLDFENYEDNVRWLLSEFGLDPTVDIPKLNASSTGARYSVTEEEIEKIKLVYKEDYLFFKSANILF